MPMFRWLNLGLDPTIGIPFVSRYLSTVILGDEAVGGIYARGLPEYHQPLVLAGQASCLSCVSFKTKAAQEIYAW